MRILTHAVVTHMLRHRRTTRKSKGIALAQFESAADAVAAHAALDRSVFQGRLLHILPGQRPPPAPTAEVTCSSAWDISQDCRTLMTASEVMASAQHNADSVSMLALQGGRGSTGSG